MARRYKNVTAVLKDIDARARQSAIDSARIAAEQSAKSLNEAVKKWKNKIVFRVMPKQQQGVTKFLIVAEGEEESLKIFGYVDQGTKPHIIKPKDPNGRLAFWTRFEARTAPIANANAGSGKSWGEIVWVKGVKHPGNEARNFTDYAALEAEEAYEQRLNELLERLRRE